MATMAYWQIDPFFPKFLKDKGLDLDDPGENPFHTSLDALGAIIKQATMHTKRGKDANEKQLPMTLLYIDDMITFTRWNSQYESNPQSRTLEEIPDLSRMVLSGR